MEFKSLMIVMWFGMASCHISARSEESITRLICNVDVTNRFASGDSERTSETIQLDIITNGPHVTILSSSDLSTIAISTKKIDQTLQTSNRSNNSQFFIHSTVRFPSGDRQQQIMVDRVTRRMAYSDIPAPNSGGMSVSIVGVCKKFEGNKRQF